MTFAGEDKGTLLYEPEGANRDRRPLIIACLAFTVIFGIIAVYATLLILEPQGTFADLDGIERYSLLVVPGIMFICAAAIAVYPFKNMPFRVYQRGVTMPYIPLRVGLAGREVFVPSGEVTRVTREMIYVHKSGPREHFRFHRLDGGTFDVRVVDEDKERVTGLLRQVLRCEVEGPAEVEGGRLR